MSKDRNSDDTDILRASDIIPGAETPHTPPLPIEELNHTGTAKTPREKDEIPKFNLAEEIMAEQRKITAVRRKAPGQKVETKSQKPKVESIEHAIERPIPQPSEQDQIIAEIVARDIEKLYRGGR